MKRLVTMEVEECWYAEAGFDCEGYCLIDIDGDGI